MFGLGSIISNVTSGIKGDDSSHYPIKYDTTAGVRDEYMMGLSSSLNLCARYSDSFRSVALWVFKHIAN